MRQRFRLVSSVFILAACIALLVVFSDSTAPTTIRAATPAATAAAAKGGDVARGEYLVAIGACRDCHGPELAGGAPFDAGPLGSYHAANLTVLQDWKDDDFLKVFHQGVDPKSGRVLFPAMPYFNYAGMSDADVLSIGAYLRSLKPINNQVPEAKPGPAAAQVLKPLPGKSVPAIKADTSVNYGQYLVRHVSSCNDCHTPRDAQGNMMMDRELQGGGMNLGTEDQPIYAVPIVGNVLTAEGYTRESFIKAIRTGIRPWGARIPVQMPWMQYKAMTDNDLTAIWNFLQTLKRDKPWPPEMQNPPQAPGAPAGTQAATKAATAAATQQR